MKKIISLSLTLAMLTTSAFSVFASPKTPDQEEFIINRILRNNEISSYQDYSNYCLNLHPNLTNEDITELYDVCCNIILEKYGDEFTFSFSEDGTREEVEFDAVMRYLEEDELIDPATLQSVLNSENFETLRYGYVCDSETIGIGDVILLSKHVSKKLTLPADSQNYKNANCDLRDSAVNADDLKAMIDYLLGTIDSLPVR